MKRLLLILGLASAGLVLIQNDIHAQRKVTDVTISGNEAYSTKQLEKMTRVGTRSFPPVVGRRPRFNVLVLRRDIAYLRAFYHDQGYLQCQVSADTEPIGENEMRVRFTIREGPLTTLAGIRFTGHTLFTAERLTSFIRRQRVGHVRVGEPVSEGAVRAGADEIIREYRDQGHFFTSVRPRVGARDTLTGSVPLTYAITEGSPVQVAAVQIEGTRSTKNFVVNREVLLDPGDTLTEEARRESQRRLYTTGLFRSVAVTVGDVTPDSTGATVLVTVNELPRRYIGTGIGVAGDSEEQIDMRLHTSAQWGHRNLYGTGRAIELSASADLQVITAWDLLQRELGLRYVEPWFWGSRTPLTAFFSLRPRSYTSYTVQEAAAEIGVSHEFNRRTRGYLNFAYRIVDTEVPIEAITSKDELRGFNAMIERDSRDNILSPTGGSLTRLTVSGYGGPLGGGATYGVGMFSWSRYMPTGQRAVMATRIRLGAALPAAGEEVPIFDRFFLGGATSVRGYRERQLGPVNVSAGSGGGQVFQTRGGQAMALFNIELRRPRHIGPFGIIFFLDAGNVWEDITRVNSKLAVSSGLGTFIDTPFGPVRFGYGWRLNSTNEESAHAAYRLPRSTWHMSVQYAF